MDEWATPIRCYLTPAGNNVLADWYADLSVQRKADMDEFVSNMRKTKDWSMPSYRPRLRGYKALGELRWTSENVKHRIIGFFADGVWYALVGCTHKGNVYTPHDALDTAKKYRELIISKNTRERARTVEYDI